MNAKELRIGNKFECMGMIQTVFELCDNTDRGRITQAGYEYIIRCEENANQYKPIEMQPIPLTEEWLLKFGFTKSYEGYGSPRFCKGINAECLDVLSVRHYYMGGFIWGFDTAQERFIEIGQPKAIVSVHELQNFWHVLTGEELTIKS
jgi:hypothetical protein